LIHKLSVGLFLGVLWLLLSGKTSPLLLILGLLSALLALYLSLRMEVIDKEGYPIHLTVSTFRFIPWLIWKIILANLEVCYQILNPKARINPVYARIKCSQKSDLGKVVFANCITLTPGTISMSIDADSIAVHALSKAGIDELEQGEMDKRVTKMVGEN